jgi:Tfp pilus assembly protein PilO
MVVVVVILVAWYLLMWGPKTRDLSDAHKGRAAAEQASSEAILKLRRLTATESRKGELLATKARYVSAVPETSDVAGIIISINDAAKASGLAFLSVTPTQPTAAVIPGGPSNVLLALTFKGDYVPVLDFLGRLSNLDRFITVDSMNLKPDIQDLTVSSVSVSLTARAFTTEPIALTGAAKAAGAAAPAAPAASTATGAAK